MITSPFLKDISIRPDKIEKDHFPFNHLTFLNSDFKLKFSSPITFFVGENGAGKSTLLEAIAGHCGFHESGGSQDHMNYTSTDNNHAVLKDTLKLSWLPKVNQGFFFRSESFFNLANYIDEYGDIEHYYGGKEMHRQSHGEAFLALFQNRLGSRTRAIYLLDEPEAALSPSRQLSFLSLLHEWQCCGNVQLIIATHSPILLSYPNAQILHISNTGVEEIAYRETEHYQLTKGFLNNPESYLKELLK